jgi:hypothetical protein
MFVGPRDFVRDGAGWRTAAKVLITIFAIVLPLMGRVEGLSATYTTSFAGTETPISEGGHWINGQTVALDWKNVNMKPGLAYGADASGTPNYNDPTALLTGTWGPDQTMQGTVLTVNQQTGSIYEEIEFRLRSTMSAHVNSGYEVNFRATHDGSQYCEIVRWNGPLGNFTYIQHVSGPGLRNGDTVKATIIGNVITAYINGVQVAQGTDSTFTSGNPGIGFYLNGIANANQDYGFTSLTASSVGTLPSPPLNLRITP